MSKAVFIMESVSHQKVFYQSWPKYILKPLLSNHAAPLEKS